MRHVALGHLSAGGRGVKLGTCLGRREGFPKTGSREAVTCCFTRGSAPRTL